MPELCEHIENANEGKAANSPAGCDDWVHLRLCLTCGHVGCCDNSKNKHATKHHHKTKHPVVKSFEPGEGWKYCYVDDVMVE